MAAIPSDNHSRAMLDGAPPACFDHLFFKVAGPSPPSQMRPFHSFGRRFLIALVQTALCGPQYRFFEHLRTITAYIVFDTRVHILKSIL